MVATQPVSGNQLNSFEARRNNALEVLLSAYEDPGVDSAADAIEAALALHGLSTTAAAEANLTGRAFVADAWVDGHVFLCGYDLVEGLTRELGASPNVEYRLSVRQAVSVAWLLADIAEGEAWSDEVADIVRRVVVDGERAPLLSQAEAA